MDADDLLKTIYKEEKDHLNINNDMYQKSWNRITNKIHKKTKHRNFSLSQRIGQAAAVCLVIIVTISMPILGKQLMNKKPASYDAKLQYIYPVDKAVEQYASKLFNEYTIEEQGTRDVMPDLDNPGSNDYIKYNKVIIYELTNGTNPRTINYLVNPNTSEVYYTSYQQSPPAESYIKCTNNDPGIPSVPDYTKYDSEYASKLAQIEPQTIYYDLNNDGKKEEIQYDPKKDLLTVDGISTAAGLGYSLYWNGLKDLKINVLDINEIKAHQVFGVSLVDKSYGCALCINISTEAQNIYYFYKDGRIVGVFSETLIIYN